jgi:hypothetical protein
MDHVRAGSFHSADTFVPWHGRPVDPGTGPNAVGTPTADARRSLPREVLLGAATTLTALGITAGILLAAAPEAEPVAPAPAPAVVEPAPAECADGARIITGRVTLRREAGDVPVGVVEVRTATTCAFGITEAGAR